MTAQTANPVEPDINSISYTYSRLVRSLSTKEVPKTTPAHGAEEPAAQSSSSARKIPKEKLTAFQRFVKLGKKAEKPQFSPTTWFEESSDPPTEVATAAAIPLPPTPAKENEKVLNDDRRIPSTSTAQEGEMETPPEPVTLAQKIQALISSLPPFTTTPLTPYPTPPNADGSPPVPPMGNAIGDSKLIAFLSSASVMNGSISRGRQSVWAALDRLRSPNKGDTSHLTGEGSVGAEDGEGDIEDDNSSVMVYGPLEPTDESEIEIARSEIMSVDDDGDVVPEMRHTAEKDSKEHKEPSAGAPKGKGTSIWPFSEIGGKAPGRRSEQLEQKQEEVQVWFPSATKISLQATWWGYRIYLPPPVLDVLSNKQIEATKRAAILTASLKWFLDKIPVKMFPPQLRGVAIILKRLAPYLGYIGAFIAWSWSSIKAFDKGDGVILTATWLLPVAVIPGTWDLKEIPVQPGPVTTGIDSRNVNTDPAADDKSNRSSSNSSNQTV